VSRRDRRRSSAATGGRRRLIWRNRRGRHQGLHRRQHLLDRQLMQRLGLICFQPEANASAFSVAAAPASIL
jgi:hypothetical protein